MDFIALGFGARGAQKLGNGAKSPFPKDGTPVWGSTIQAKLTSLKSMETICISRIGWRSGPRV